VFARDEKVSQLKRGTRHNCRIDETIQLEVTGDKESGEPLTWPSKQPYFCSMGKCVHQASVFVCITYSCLLSR